MKFAKSFYLSTMLLAVPTSEVFAYDLTKQEASQILNYMGCNPARVVSVVNGVGGIGMGTFSSPNVAYVLVACQLNKNPAAEQYSFLYDDDLGWFYQEVHSDPPVSIRIWTKTGFKQFAPPPALP